MVRDAQRHRVHADEGVLIAHFGRVLWLDALLFLADERPYLVEFQDVHLEAAHADVVKAPAGFADFQSHVPNGLGRDLGDALCGSDGAIDESTGIMDIDRRVLIDPLGVLAQLVAPVHAGGAQVDKRAGLDAQRHLAGIAHGLARRHVGHPFGPKYRSTQKPIVESAYMAPNYREGYYMSDFMDHIRQNYGHKGQLWYRPSMGLTQAGQKFIDRYKLKLAR